MASARLKLQHHLSQTFVRDFVLELLFVCLRDLVVLTINTTKIAVAEEDITSALCSDERRLLAKVRRVRRHDRQTTRIARRNLVVETIVQTILRTDGATLQQSFERFDTLLEDAVAQ